jgi:hypothetical protein
MRIARGDSVTALGRTDTDEQIVEWVLTPFSEDSASMFPTNSEIIEEIAASLVALGRVGAMDSVCEFGHGDRTEGCFPVTDPGGDWTRALLPSAPEPTPRVSRWPPHSPSCGPLLYLRSDRLRMPKSPPCLQPHIRRGYLLPRARRHPSAGNHGPGSDTSAFRDRCPARAASSRADRESPPAA